ncbi:MAG: hypothetical protein WBG17_00250 [Burkholderiaceae bacterium]
MQDKFNKITIQLEGAAQEGGDLTLSNFIEHLNNVRALLAEADRIVAGEQQTTVFRVTNLSHSSPAAVELTGFPRIPDKDFSNQVVEYVAQSLDNLIRKKQFPKNATQKFVRDIKKFVGGVGKRVEGVKVYAPTLDSPIVITDEIAKELDATVLRQVRSFGSVKGIMQTYNSHAKTKYFNLYPPIPGVEVKCTFSKDLLVKAAEAVEKNVTVTGMLTYTVGNVFPDEVQIHDIVVHSSDSELPKLESFGGVASDATGEQSTQDFIKQLRNEWN